MPRRLCVMLLLVAARAFPGWAQPLIEGPAGEEARAPVSGAQGRVDYTIEVRLDPEAKLLRGSQVTSWRNQTAVPATELRFHLYFNAWRNNRSTWFLEAELRGSVPEDLDDLGPEDWGYLDVDRLTVARGGERVDLTDRLVFDAPDDGNEEDRTVLVVPLSRPLQPDESVDVEIEFTTKIPRTFSRTGYRGDFFFLAHWFPKLGVYEEDGTWNCHQFHAATEFFSHFGTYDVRMTVPTGWLLGATGREVEVMANRDETSTHHYRQERVHGFAWTTSPDYREATRTFESPGLRSVELRLLYQPEHEAQVERHFAATEAALRLYGEWYGEYPYSHLTVVDPAWESGAGGMEYPTLFTCGTRLHSPEGSGRPESVTIHETGHQFWYGVVANNEFEHAWLDEGINRFSDARVYHEAFGPLYLEQRFLRDFLSVVRRDVVRNRFPLARRRERYRNAARSDVPARPTYRYHPATAVGITYAKTALWLGTLERMLGWDELQPILQAFFERYRFRHPRPEDFFNVANEVSVEDLEPFFDQVHRSSAVFDFGVDSVETRKLSRRGYFRVREGGDLVFHGPLVTEGSVTQPRLAQVWESTVVVRRHGDGILPVEVLLAFENGEEVRDLWRPRREWKLYRVRRSAPLSYATVDPERKLLLDLDWTNNSKLVEERAAMPASKWASKWMLWLQDFAQTASFLF